MKRQTPTVQYSYVLYGPKDHTSVPEFRTPGQPTLPRHRASSDGFRPPTSFCDGLTYSGKCSPTNPQPSGCKIIETTVTRQSTQPAPRMQKDQTQSCRKQRITENVKLFLQLMLLPRFGQITTEQDAIVIKSRNQASVGSLC